MELQALLFDVDGTLADTERDGHRVAFNAAFEKFFSKTVHDHVVKDGKVDAAGAAWLKTHLFADLKKVDAGQAAILASVHKKAKTKHADLDKLHTDYEAHRAKAAKK